MAKFYKAPVILEDEPYIVGKELIMQAQASGPTHVALAYWPIALLPLMLIGLIIVRRLAARHAAAARQELSDEMDAAAG